MSSRTLAVAAGAIVVALATLSITLGTGAHAQTVPAGEPLTVIVGTPQAGAAGTAMDRIDGRRSNASHQRLPTSSLRILWTRQTRPMAYPPVVMRDGTVAVVGNDAVIDLFNADGTTQAHLPVGPGPLSAPALLTDGTLVVVNGAGEIIGVRRHEVAFRARGFEPGSMQASELPTVTLRPHGAGVLHTHIRRSSGNGRPTRSAGRSSTLPLDDGGIAIAFDTDLVLADARGAIKRHAIAPMSIASPLLALGASVPTLAFVTENGDVYAWTVEESVDAVRLLGSFGGSIDGSVVVEDERHLLGIVRGARLVSFDTRTGLAETRATAPVSRGFTDALALGVSSPGAGVSAFVQEITFAGTRLLTIDHEGHALPFATGLSTQGAPSLGLPDAGATLPPIGLLLMTDPTGTVAYATLDGHVGVMRPTSKHELGTLPCGVTDLSANGRLASNFIGLVPVDEGAFVVACKTGGVSLVRGSVE